MASSYNRGTFVLIKGKTCGFCKRLAPHIPEIRKRVEGKGITFIEYEVDEMWKPPNGPNGKYPESVGYVGMWYPFIFYTSSDNWREIVAGKDLRSQLSVLNGSFNGKEYVLGKQTYNPMNEDHIMKWLDDITSKTTITNAVVAPRNIITSTIKQPPIKHKIETDKRMKIVPRKKYGK